MNKQRQVVFHGVTPHNARTALASRILPWFADRVGNYTAQVLFSGILSWENALAFVGWRGPIYWNDVGMLQAYLAYAARGEFRPLRLTDYGRETYPFLPGLVDTVNDSGSPFRAVALLVFMARYFRIAKSRMIHNKVRADTLLRSYRRVLVNTEKAIIAQFGKANLRIDKMFVEDAHNILEREESSSNPGEGKVFLAYPPIDNSYQSNYEWDELFRVFGWHVDIQSVPDNFEAFVMRLARFPNWVIGFAIDEGEEFARRYKNYHVATVVAARGIPRHIYASLHGAPTDIKVAIGAPSPKRSVMVRRITGKGGHKAFMTRFLYLPDDFTPAEDTPVGLVRLSLSEYEYLRSLFLRKVPRVSGGVLITASAKPGVRLSVYGVTLGPYLAGYFAIQANPEQLRRDGIVHDVSDLITGGWNVRRLSKLIIMAIRSSDAIALMERDFVGSIREIVTWVATDKPVSMKYRGEWELIGEGRLRPAKTRALRYRTRPSGRSLREEYLYWLCRHYRGQKPGFCREEFIRSVMGRKRRNS